MLSSYNHLQEDFLICLLRERRERNSRKLSLGFFLTVFIVIALISSCYYYPPIPPIGGDTGNDKNAPSINEIPSLIDEGKVLEDALSGAPGLIVDDGSSTHYLSKSASARSSASYQLIVTFTGYDNGSCYISSGSMTFTLNASSDGTRIEDYEASASDMVISKEKDLPSITVSASALAGTVNGVAVDAASASITIEGTFSSSRDTLHGSFSSGSESISIPETEGIISGGNGTEESPYLIETAEELGNMFSFDAGTYFMLANDITVPADTFYNTKAFSYHLDGNGNALILDGQMEIRCQDFAEYGLFQTLGNGSISNLDFHTSGLKALGFQIGTNAVFTFNNVDVYGQMLGVDTNVGPYVVFVGAGSNVTFTGCDNHADITDTEGGEHYGSAFIGGYYYKGEAPTVTFTDCNNYGDIFFGKYAALFIGNPTNYVGTPAINNCHNYGRIAAGVGVGGITWNDNTGYEKYNADGGSIEVLGTIITSFTVSANGTYTLLPENLDNTYSVSFSARSNTTFGSEGNRQETFAVDPAQSEGNLPVKAYYDESIAANHESGDLVKQADGTYWMFVNPADYSSEFSSTGTVQEKLNYYVMLRNGSGDIVGTAIAK